VASNHVCTPYTRFRPNNYEKINAIMQPAAVRSCGILLHPTSLPGPHGIGSLGAHARAFIDFLHTAGQSLWQVLPLGPTGYGDSPYASSSTFAGNPLLIDLEPLVADGWLLPSDVDHAPASTSHVNYAEVVPFKTAMLRRASERFRTTASGDRKAKFDAFQHEHAWWLEDFAMFDAIKQAHDGRSIREWDNDVRRRDPQTIERVKTQLATEIHRRRITQFLFFEQWEALRTYAHAKGVRVVGDVPIFVAFDSDAVWARPELFKVDENLVPSVVAGVPPDYFAEAGQLWGNPLYNWDAHAKEGFAWWLDRMKMALHLADIVRLDHFRGFEAAWEVPADHTDARRGTWVTGPGDALFDAMRERFGHLPLIAEDLGVITDEVRALRDRHQLPGMHVLQFGFGADDDRCYAPHRAVQNGVVYTGTHDNDTTNGWYRTLPPKDRAFIQSYLDIDDTSRDSVHKQMIRAAYGTVANTAIIPMQDVLGLGSEARMNTPGQVGPWWAYRLETQPNQDVADDLKLLTQLYDR